MDVEYLVSDTLENVRPKNKFSASWEEACAAAEEMDREFRAKLGQFTSFTCSSGHL